MIQSRDELLDTLRRLERNPATAHFMVRAPKGRKASPQERLLKHVLRGAEAAQQATESDDSGHEEASQALTKAPEKRQERVSEAAPEIEATSEPRRWMSTKDVTQYIGICPATLYRLINEQGFPRPRKLGHLSRWLRDEIDAHLMALPTMVIPKIDWVGGKKPKKNSNKN